MLPLKEFTHGTQGLPSLLAYFEFIAEGVVLNRDGSLLSSFYYCGPDMDAMPEFEEDQLSQQLQLIFQQFGNGWSVHVDLIRVLATVYPEAHFFNNPTSVLIENQCRARYQNQGDHFDNIYTISFSYLPSVVETKAINHFFSKNKRQEPSSVDLNASLEIFNQKLQEFQGHLSAKMRMTRMSSAQMMTFLDKCIANSQSPVPVPKPPCYLNHYLGAHELIGSPELKVDEWHIGVITLTQFPFESYGGILKVLTALPFTYRFSTRFLFYDPVDALQIIEEYQGKYLGMKYSIGQLIMGALGKDPRLSPDAANRSVLTKIEETKQAQEALELGLVNYGYATLSVIIFDKDKALCKSKLEYVRDLLNNHWFPCLIEGINALEAFLGSLPGETIKNIRKPFISTYNLAHLIALTDVWTGSAYNPCPYYPPNSPPLFYAKTQGNTPFRFNLHVGDVGHTLILGPTGAGKSVLLSHIANSALRYQDAKVYIFDKGYSQFVLTHALGGQFYDLMGDGDELAFCPLSDLDKLSVQQWACGWVESLVRLQGIDITPLRRSVIESAIRDTSQAVSKTLSDFYLNLQDQDIKEALRPFVQIKDGYMASLLDAPQDGFKKAQFQTFEISQLMGLEPRLSTPVLLYLFHKILTNLDGSPTFILIDEGWLIMLHETFMSYWIEFLRTIRKNNACVVLATQSLADIAHSPYVNFINESCMTKIFLPNPAAREADNSSLYASFGLNERQINIISEAKRKREYYLSSRDVGHRLIDLGLKDLELAFYAAGTMPQERQQLNMFKKTYKEEWVLYWLKSKGLMDLAHEWLEIKKGINGD